MSATTATIPAPESRIVGDDPRFEILDDEQVLDRSTGLIWTRNDVPGGRMTWNQAQEACAALELGGTAGWRLPSVRELLTLVDYERTRPAIDVEAFPSCKPSWYWSSTPLASSPGDDAWFVSFAFGGAGWGGRDDGGFVRAVRSAPASQ